MLQPTKGDRKNERCKESLREIEEMDSLPRELIALIVTFLDTYHDAVNLALISKGMFETVKAMIVRESMTRLIFLGEEIIVKYSIGPLTKLFRFDMGSVKLEGEGTKRDRKSDIVMSTYVYKYALVMEIEHLRDDSRHGKYCVLRHEKKFFDRSTLEKNHIVEDTIPPHSEFTYLVESGNYHFGTPRGEWHTRGCRLGNADMEEHDYLHCGGHDSYGFRDGTWVTMAEGERTRHTCIHLSSITDDSGEPLPLLEAYTYVDGYITGPAREVVFDYGLGTWVIECGDLYDGHRIGDWVTLLADPGPIVKIVEWDRDYDRGEVQPYSIPIFDARDIEE